MLRLQFEKIPGRLCIILVALAAVGAAHEPNENPVAAPRDLKTTARQLCVNLQWDGTQGSMAYEIERSATPFGPFKKLPNNLPQLTLYNDFVGEVATNFYRVRSIPTNSEGHLLPSDWSEPVEGRSEAFNQEQLLTDVQRASFDYFYQYAHPDSGLARASARRNPDICAIGASGMGIFNLGVGIERGFITREEGAEQVLKEFRFLLQRADSFHGAFPHFINGRTGETIPFSKYDDGADIVETAFLMEGVLFAREYFSQANPKEAEIRALAGSLWRGVEWDWFVNQSNRIPAMVWHWSPRYGWKKNLYILGFNECQIVYVLALASPTHPINPECYWNGWESGNYARGSTQFGIHVELGGCSDVGPPLFFTQYSYLGLDPRELVFRGRVILTISGISVGYRTSMPNPGRRCIRDTARFGESPPARVRMVTGHLLQDCGITARWRQRRPLLQCLMFPPKACRVFWRCIKKMVRNYGGHLVFMTRLISRAIGYRRRIYA